MPVGGALSHSSVATYLECPQRWKFLYIDRRTEAPRGYFSFGRTVHAVLEELVRPFLVPADRRVDDGDRQRTLEDFGGRTEAPAPTLLDPAGLLALYERRWVSEGYTSPAEEARYRELGADLLLRYREILAARPPRPVAVEAHLEARWDGIPVHGYLDRIDRTATGGLEIVDYKTSRELTDADARASDQLTFYQVLVERNFPDPVERLTLYHLRGLKPLGTPPRDRARVARLHDRVGRVRDGIAAEAWEPTPGRHCGRCEFRPICPEFRDVPEPDRERLAALVDRFAELRAAEARLTSDLEAAAAALHAEAERLGVRRIRGRRQVAVREREESWRYPREVVAPLLAAHGLADRVDAADPAALRRLVADPSVDARLRRRLAGAGGRSVRWFWRLDADAAR